MYIAHRIKILLVLAFIITALCGCEKIDLDALNEGNSALGSTDNTEVKVATRSTSPLSFPLYLYAFKDDGTLLTKQTFESEEEDMVIMVPKNTECRIVALSANRTSYQWDESPKLSSTISFGSPQLPDGVPDDAVAIAQGFTTGLAMQMGSANLLTKTDNANVTIQQNYQVASINITLQNLPEDCPSAFVSIANSAKGITFGGQTIDTQTARIPLNKKEGKWQSGVVYIMPTVGSQTTFTIAYDNTDGEQYASVNYLAPLKQGTPYSLNGILSNGNISVSGSVSPAAWGNPVNLDFSFSPDITTTITADGDSPDSSNDVFEVEQIPEALSVWDGHIVISSTEKDNNTAELMLMSLTDYSGLTSAFNTTTPNAASDCAQNYTEYNIESWRIPTSDEAMILRETYLTYTDSFDSLIESTDADAIVLTDDKGTNLRYLCDNAEKTFSFKAGSSYNSIKQGGATVKNYRLRLVKTITVKKQ